MKRAEVWKLGPQWLIAREDGKHWAASIADDRQRRTVRFHTHAEALAHALAEVGLTGKETR